MTPIIQMEQIGTYGASILTHTVFTPGLLLNSHTYGIHPHLCPSRLYSDYSRIDSVRPSVNSL